MTREELQAIKDKAARATAIVAEIEALERFKSERDLTKLAGEIGEATNISILPVDNAQLASVLRAGTETRITQLEQELADITVEEPKLAMPAKAACSSCLVEFDWDGVQIFCPTCRNNVFKVQQPEFVLLPHVTSSSGTLATPSQPFAEIVSEPLIAGGVHP